MKHFLLLIAACMTAISLNAQSLNVIADTGDALTVDVTATGKKEAVVYSTAEEFLCQTLMFRGIPGSITLRDPLIGVDENASKDEKAYVEKMISGGRFASFITSSRVIEFNKKAKPKEGVVRFVVNIRAIRKDLEAQGIKRQFGF